jgi:hypothetical protein
MAVNGHFPCRMTSRIALFALSPDAVMVVQNELRHALMISSVCALMVSMNFCEMISMQLIG